MLFSIIVPVYNVEKYIDECIQSIINQNFKDFELILIDDGSTDSSGNICDKYSNQYSFVSTIHKSNGGQSSAWVEGLKHANGEYVCSIDSDDYVEAGFLEKIKNKIDKYYCDIVVYGYKSVGKYEQINEIRVEEGFYNKKRIESEIIPTLINVGNTGKRNCIYLSRVNKIIRRELLVKNAIYYRTDISYGEDDMWTIPNVLTADSIYVFANYYPYCYRNNPDSITHRYNEGLWKKFVLLDSHIKHICSSLGYIEVLNEQLKRDMAFHALLTINSEMLSDKSSKTIINNINEVLNYKTVNEGLKLMNYSTCGYRERMILSLMKTKNAYLVFLYKKIRSLTRKIIK